MKRYKVMAVHKYDESFVDGIGSTELLTIESADGEWVKHKDIACLNAEIERLRLIADDKINEACKLSRLDIHAEGGSCDIEVKTPVVYIIAESLAHEFKQAGGVNYVEFKILTEDLGPLVLTMQRVDGKTPGEIADELRTENTKTKDDLELTINVLKATRIVLKQYQQLAEAQEGYISRLCAVLEVSKAVQSEYGKCSCTSNDNLCLWCSLGASITDCEKEANYGNDQEKN